MSVSFHFTSFLTPNATPLSFSYNVLFVSEPITFRFSHSPHCPEPNLKTKFPTLRDSNYSSAAVMGKVTVGAAVVCAAAVCAAAALVVRHRMISSRKWSRAVAILKEFEDNCGTPIVKLRQVADAMDVEMHAGLASEGGSKLSMVISFVDNLPTGYVDLSHLFSFFFILSFLILIILIKYEKNFVLIWLFS